jgi:hypothetical protein
MRSKKNIIKLLLNLLQRRFVIQKLIYQLMKLKINFIVVDNIEIIESKKQIPSRFQCK